MCEGAKWASLWKGRLRFSIQIWFFFVPKHQSFDFETIPSSLFSLSLSLEGNRTNTAFDSGSTLNKRSRILHSCHGACRRGLAHRSAAGMGWFRRGNRARRWVKFQGFCQILQFGCFLVMVFCVLLNVNWVWSWKLVLRISKEVGIWGFSCYFKYPGHFLNVLLCSVECELVWSWKLVMQNLCGSWD